MDALEILKREGCTCVLCGGGSMYKSHTRGVSPLLHLLDEGTDVKGFAAADKVVGRATAFLYCLLTVKSVHACIISEPALKVLTAHGIAVSWDEKVPAIRNRSGDGPCFLEAVTAQLSDPRDALQAIRKTLQQLQDQ